jgi:hypothetical protein
MTTLDLLADTARSLVAQVIEEAVADGSSDAVDRAAETISTAIAVLDVALTSLTAPRCTCCNQDRELLASDCGHLYCSSCLHYDHDDDCPACELIALAGLEQEDP